MINFEDLDNKQKTYVVDLLLKQYKTALKREDYFSSQRSMDHENGDERLKYYTKICNVLYDVLVIVCPKNKNFLELNKKFGIEQD